MGYRRIADVMAPAGTYMHEGETKTRYDNVGVLMQNEDGKYMVLLKATFNPAGVRREDGRESIMLPCFEPRDNTQQQQRQPAAQQRRAAPVAQGTDPNDIPF